MKATDLSKMLEEYFRHSYHPHVAELLRKYPAAKNPNILSKLVERYHSSLMTDEEYSAMWNKHIFESEPFLAKIPKRNFCGASIPIPFNIAR